jgi:hypothetical protein
MSDDEFTHIQNIITAVTNTISNVDLDGFIDRLFEAEALGPTEDPAMWKMAEDKMRQVKECAHKLRELRDLVAVHADEEKATADELEKHLKVIESKHEDASQTTNQPTIPNDPSFLLPHPEEES